MSRQPPAEMPYADKGVGPNQRTTGQVRHAEYSTAHIGHDVMRKPVPSGNASTREQIGEPAVMAGRTMTEK